MDKFFLNQERNGSFQIPHKGVLTPWNAMEQHEASPEQQGNVNEDPREPQNDPETAQNSSEIARTDSGTT